MSLLPVHQSDSMQTLLFKLAHNFTDPFAFRDTIVTVFEAMTTEQKNAIAAALGITSIMEIKGSWDASTNTPALASGAGNAGDTYIVGVAGATVLDGHGPWKVGNMAIFSGTSWLRVEGQTVVAATTSAAGIVQLATTTEASTGTDTAKAVTPAGVMAAILANAPEPATTTTAGVVLLAGSPDETANPGSTKVLTADHFNAAGVVLSDSLGGLMLANQVQASFLDGQAILTNYIGSRTPGLTITNDSTTWRMQIGTATPEDTVVDVHGVGSSNGMWRVGNSVSGRSLLLTGSFGGISVTDNPLGGDAGSHGIDFLDLTGLPMGGFTNNSFSGGGLALHCYANAGIKIYGPGGSIDTDAWRSSIYHEMQVNLFSLGQLRVGADSNGNGVVFISHATGQLGFFGKTPVAKQTGTPANATDLATAITLVNNLKAKLIAYGLIA